MSPALSHEIEFYYAPQRDTAFPRLLLRNIGSQRIFREGPALEARPEAPFFSYPGGGLKLLADYHDCKPNSRYSLSGLPSKC